jgi:outer membrane autotransporter protein
VKDQRAPLHRTLPIPAFVLLLVVLGFGATAFAQDQFNSMKSALGPNCGTQRDENLSNCGCNVNQLNTEELRGIAPDEVSAQGTMSTALRTQQLRVLGARLAALRSGVPTLSQTSPSLVVEQEPMRVTQVPTVSDAGKASSAPLGRFGVFVNGSTAWGDRDRTDLEEGYDFKNYGFTAGGDYRITNNLILGLAFNYYNTDADINFNLGDVQADSYGVSLYGTYYVGNFFIDVLGGLSWNNYDGERHIVVPTQNVDVVAKSDTDGQQSTVAIGLGYEFRLGRFSFTPLGRLEYVNLEVDRYQESGAGGMGLEVKDQTTESLQSSLGLQVAASFGLPFGVLVPQVRGEWRHEYSDDQRAITARFVDDPSPNAFFSTQTDKPDRDFFVVAAGLSSQFAHGLSAFVNYETFLGLSNFTRHEFTGGIRIEF